MWCSSAHRNEGPTAYAVERVGDRFPVTFVKERPALQCSYVLTVLAHNPHGGEVGEMHTKSQWRALRIALQREADVILYSSGETVLIESGSTVAMMRSR